MAHVEALGRSLGEPFFVEVSAAGASGTALEESRVASSGAVPLSVAEVESSAASSTVDASVGRLPHGAAAVAELRGVTAADSKSAPLSSVSVQPPSFRSIAW